MVYRYLLEEMYLLHINMQNNKYLPVKYKIQYKTRGPRGPWVAHLRKRSKVTV